MTLRDVADARPAGAAVAEPVADSVYVSALDLFSIGIGPSSSHTVGPMRAGRDFAERALARHLGAARLSLEVELLGSLAATGIGHGSPDALVAGLRGLEPETCDPDEVIGSWSAHPVGAPLLIGGVLPVAFDRDAISFGRRSVAPGTHPNTLTITLRAADGAVILTSTYASIGGGFIERDGMPVGGVPDAAAPARDAKVAFGTAAELLAVCAFQDRSIAEVAWESELQTRSAGEVRAGLGAIWGAMQACVAAGLETEGVLPGRLRVPRRAPVLRRDLERTGTDGGRSGERWLAAFALAVNEENAAGRRVVTAPTNGAAGIVPAVLHHLWHTIPGANTDLVHTFLLTAAAIGSLLKANASISGAEGGCQAEVGSACAMAAAGLCAVLGGSPAQVENAAEIAVEHHLGLTCDPVGGLVQIPCIERNAVAASTAVTAARLALHGDGRHIVSLDTVIETMRQTGADMSVKYKETSAGGLAVNVVEC